MKHIYFECENPDCDGSCTRCCLAHCKVCFLAEGELTTDCPGVKATDKGDDVYDGKLDFIKGDWVKNESKNLGTDSPETKDSVRADGDPLV